MDLLLDKNGLKTCEEAIELVKFISDECPLLEFKGLMTIGSIGGQESDFPKLIEICRRIESTFDWLEANQLERSFGMSDDFERAVNQLL